MDQFLRCWAWHAGFRRPPARPPSSRRSPCRHRRWRSARNTKLDPAKTYGRIVIKQSGITIDGAGASVIGATKGDAKDYKWVGVSATGVSNVTLKNLTVKGWDVGLQIEHGSNWTVENCNFSDNFHYPAWGWGDLGDHGGIVLKYVDHSTFRNNKANRVWDACGLINSDYNVFEKNDFSHTSNTCVWTVTACHNRFTDNNLSWGLRISPGETHARDSCCVLIEYGSDNNYFGHNDITYGGDGVFLRPLNGWISRGNVFEDNDTSYAHNNCIESQSPGNIFRRNKANYGSHGIWIGLSDESVIEDNEACHNGDPKFNRNAGFPMASATFEPKGAPAASSSSGSAAIRSAAATSATATTAPASCCGALRKASGRRSIIGSSTTTRSATIASASICTCSTGSTWAATCWTTRRTT